MIRRSSALFAVFLLFIVQIIGSTNGQPLSSQWDYDFPEIDGSVVKTCEIFPVLTPDNTATTTTSPAATTKRAAETTPVKQKQVLVITKKPAARSTSRKNGAPVRPQPAPSVPNSKPSLTLLHHLLINSRHNQGGSPTRSRTSMSQTVRQEPHRGQSSSESDESPSTLQNGAGRAEKRRRKTGSSSSEESTD